MHYSNNKVMKEELNYQNIIQETLARFPEYLRTHHYKDNDPEIPFSFFYGFTQYIMEKINDSKLPEGDEKIINAFRLFNEMIESNDEKVSTLGVTEVLENLVQEEKSKNIASKLLRETGQGFLSQVLEFTGVEE